MNEKEAMERIRDHNRIHSKQEPYTPLLNEAMCMALDALEKQIAAKPSDVDYVCIEDDVINSYQCSECGCYGLSSEFTHCPYCGKAIDWEE